MDDLREIAISVVGAEGLSDAELERVLGDFATVQSPEYLYVSELITLDSKGGGTSRKPGNIVLNWRRLFDLVPDVGVAAVGGIGHDSFVVALIALYVWNKVWRGSETPLSDAEASVIEALWRKDGRARTVSSDEAFELTNELRRARSADELTRSGFEAAISVLSSMQCVEVTDDSIWLREWVRKRT